MDELEKQKKKDALNPASIDQMNVPNSVVMPTVVFVAMKFAFEYLTKLPHGAKLSVLLVENAIFGLLTFFLLLATYFHIKLKFTKVATGPKLNHFVPGLTIEKFSLSPYKMPANYPIHPDFLSTTKALKFVRVVYAIAFGGMILLTILSRFPKLPDANMLGLSSMFIAILPCILYVSKAFRLVEERCRFDSFELAQAAICEVDLIAISREMFSNHVTFKLTVKLNNVLKNYHVRPYKQGTQIFLELQLKNEECPQKISVYMSQSSGEPIGLATAKGVIWLSNMEVGTFLMPPEPTTRLLTLSRPLVPLQYDKGLALLADNKQNNLQDAKFAGTWKGLVCFDKSTYTQLGFTIKLAKGTGVGLTGTYHAKALGKLYGKVKVDARVSGNEIYMNIVYLTYPWSKLEACELWAGLYDPDTKQICGTLKKGDSMGSFVMTQDL